MLQQAVKAGETLNMPGRGQKQPEEYWFKVEDSIALLGLRPIIEAELYQLNSFCTTMRKGKPLH